MRHMLSGVTLVFCLALPVFAQEVPRFELYGGPAYLRDPNDVNRFGWVASFSTNVNKWFAVKNEVGGVYNADGEDIHSFLLGPQFTFRRGSRVEPWAHFLVGPQVRQEFSVFPSFGGGLGLVPFPRAYFAMEPGGGFDVPLNSRMSFRFGVDYVRTFRNFNDIDSYRAHTGIVVKLH